MIVHQLTGLTFTNQKQAKTHFGNHRYRRMVKSGDIFFTNYRNTVANDLIQKNNV